MGKRKQEKIKPLTLEEEHVIVVRGYKKLHERFKKLQDAYVWLLTK